MDEIQRENERLQAKIDGLKQEYEKIGLQVFHSFKESFFQGLEDFLTRRKSQTQEEDYSNGHNYDNNYNGNSYNASTESTLFGWNINSVHVLY